MCYMYKINSNNATCLSPFTLIINCSALALWD